MPAKSAQNISLTPELQRLVSEKVASGHYRSASEVVRAALRLFFESAAAPTPTPVLGRGWTQQQLTALFTQSTAGIAVVDLTGRFTSVNDRYCSIVGRSREELLYLRMQDITHPDDLGRNLKLFAKAASNDRSFEIEKRYIRPDGSVVWVNNSVSPVRSAAGQPESILAVTVDITAHHERARALQASESHLRLALDAGRMAVWESDTRTETITSSPELNRLLGFPEDASPSSEEIRMRYAPGSQDRLHAVAAAVLSRGERNAEEELEVIWPDGSHHWLLLRADLEAVPGPGGRMQMRATGVVFDITERKIAEQSNARLAAIVSSSSDAIASFAAEDKRILTWNRGAEALFGYTEEEAVGGPVSLLVSPEHLTELENETGVFDRAMAEGYVRLDTIRRRKDGTLVDVSVTAARMVDAQGRALGVSAIFRDITERKRWEERQRLLINELNHRVKNTLATVQSIASQTLRNASTLQDARTAFEGRLLALSRTHDVLTRESWEGAELREIVAQAVEPYSNAREDRLHLRGPQVRLSPHMALSLAMALQELATNAVKYGALSNSAGEVCIDWSVTWKSEGPRLSLTWRESGGPPVEAPSRRGFGTRLIERSLAQDLDGHVQIEFASTGVVCTVSAPLELP